MIFVTKFKNNNKHSKMLNNAQVYGVSGGVSASAALIAVLIILRSSRLSRNVKIASSAGAVAACAVVFALSSYGVLKSRDDAGDDDAGNDTVNAVVCTTDDSIGGTVGATASIQSIGGTYLNNIATPKIDIACNPHIGVVPDSASCPKNWTRQETVRVNTCRPTTASDTTIDAASALGIVDAA